MWLKKSKKKLGGVVLYQAMEQTRSRELAAYVSNPRTPQQMGQRVKWANLVNFYRINKSWMKYAFETKGAQQSEYNKFMSVNVASSNIYFTKTMAAMGACVVFPYIITQGSLTPIEVTAGGTGWLSNIYVPGDFSLGNTTTIAQLTAAILPYNPAIREGDQISFIRFTQMTNSDTGAPYVVVRTYELLLNSSSAELVKDFLPLDYIKAETYNDMKAIAVHDSGAAGGFALILSRTTGGRTYVSTQRVVVANNDTLLTYYSSSSMLSAAVASYGDGEDAFLSSTTAGGQEAAPTVLSLLSFSKGGTPLMPGSEVNCSAWQAQDTITAAFNDVVTGTAVSGRLETYGGTPVTLTGTISGGAVTLTLPANFDVQANPYLQRLVVTIDGSNYQATFSHDDSGGPIGDAE